MTSCNQVDALELMAEQSGEGARRAACRSQVADRAVQMGIPKRQVEGEMRKAAAAQASDSIRSCLESLSYTTATASQITADHRTTCKTSASADVLDAGGQPGDVDKLIQAGARKAAGEAIRDC